MLKLLDLAMKHKYFYDNVQLLTLFFRLQVTFVHKKLNIVAYWYMMWLIYTVGHKKRATLL